MTQKPMSEHEKILDQLRDVASHLKSLDERIPRNERAIKVATMLDQLFQAMGDTILELAWESSEYKRLGARLLAIIAEAEEVVRSSKK